MDDRVPIKRKFSWWERRTKIEKCLLVISGFCVVVIIYLASNLLMTFPTSKEGFKQDICMSEKCISSAASILESVDKTVDPCEDFYKFACGKFIKNRVIPEDQTIVSTISQLDDKLVLQLNNFYDEPIRSEDPYSLKLIKKIYTSCMNMTKIEQEGLTFMKNEFRELGGWPVIESYWNEKMFDWMNLLYRLQKMGWRYTFFFNMYIGNDQKNASKNLFTLSKPCLPHDRLKKGLNDTAVKATYDLMVEYAVLFGADRSTAVRDMKDVIDFEIDFAKLVVKKEVNKNLSLDYNPTTIREMQRNYTSFPWLKLINNYLAPIDMYTSDDVINIESPPFFQRLGTFLPKVKKRTLANYMFSKLVRAAVDYLPSEFRRKQHEYFRIVYGQNEITPRWKICKSHADRLYIAMSSIHIKNFFDKNLKDKVSELVTDIKQSFVETLKRISWMDRKTKKHALLKAESMNSFIGYPEEVLDDNIVEEYHSPLELDTSKNFLEINFNLSKFAHNKYIQELRGPVNNSDWKTRAETYYVNAYYSQIDNTIDLPAGILQDHFFDPERPQYMNYGGLGEVIGHEITHGFDDTGRQYDKDGSVIDWWEPETNRTFTKKSQCLVEQYGNYTIPEIEMKLNGVKTLGENIADNGGIKIAYKGYLKWLERNKEEPRLPGIPYSPRQLFWVAAAMNWCTKYKKEALKQTVLLGYHSPTYFRVIIPFMNSDYFARDFNCPLGSPMNPKYKCRVW